MDFDRLHIWHPYNSLPSLHTQLEVESANHCLIKLRDGRELIDAMSSWWSAIHGYNHPVINAAAKSQIDQLSHIMFGGFTHQPAIELAELLISISPKGLDKIFFADSGSISVEVALKVSLQYWKSRNQPEKSKFLALKHAYHGDSFGAMSVCDPDEGMHSLFKDNIMQNVFAPSPGLAKNMSNCLIELEALFIKHQHQLAAFILEPLVQGAGGMLFYPAEYLIKARELCNRYQVLLIADEIATGFGRTGKLFACEWANISPDIMCVGKGLTGGYMTLAAMLCTEHISQTISQAQPGLLMHGPTFMGNPLACKIAYTSTRLLLDSPWQQRVRHIEQTLKHHFTTLKNLEGIKDVRVLGAIGVIELEQDGIGQDIQQIALKKGVWLRPFGRIIYTMPAYSIKPDQLETLAKVIVEAVTLGLQSSANPDETLVNQFV
ncbi:adenosylmethionine--8-amino-7-oxononanoate transaminase [Thiomicrospira microaerophila]|uniref:adenosylmethionine--8-amino-7-oxononanoate transaminase n=1 Tax=Thiomicrospira microaerophila TaxID=406020 RepID=UPI00200E9117|nr:adenosylmethionine--8-amino-7-oxononanoate transaminase [Thiomicrospira microaerophila]